jgi:hypothetical protein
LDVLPLSLPPDATHVSDGKAVCHKRAFFFFFFFYLSSPKNWKSVFFVFDISTSIIFLLISYFFSWSFIKVLFSI